MPSELSDLGIDGTFKETRREVQNDKVLWYMRKMAREGGSIIIATDADAEGDVIAWDVHELLKDINPDIMRMRLKGMDELSIKESLEEITHAMKQDAVPGRARAIIDRLIGHTFSKGGKGYGRVSTGLLGIVHHSGANLSVVDIKLTAPAKDGQQPWVTTFPCRKVITEAIGSKLVALTFPALEMKARRPAPADMMNMGDIMVKAADQLGITPKETATSMQRLYETGQMSYPRSGSRGVSKGAQRRLARLIAKSGLAGSSERIAEKTGDDTHDAPYPVVDVDVSKDPAKLGDDMGICTLIARQTVKSSLKREQQAADAAVIFSFLKNAGFSDEVSNFVASRAWTREIGPKMAGDTAWQKSEVNVRMPEAV
jgi:DNA topoisomerase-1